MGSASAGCRIIPAGDIRVEIVARPKEADTRYVDNRREVERVWQKALLASPGLFNGTLLSLVRLVRRSNQLRVQGQLVEYKYLVAHLRRPSLELAIEPIGVSGLVVLREGRRKHLVVARRSETVTTFPGFLELVPSGSIDGHAVDRFGRVDYRAQLLRELSEETGLSRTCVRRAVGFAVVLDATHHVCDICCRVLIEATRRSVANGFRRSTEYQELVFVGERDIAAFLAQNARMTVPTSVALMKAYVT